MPDRARVKRDERGLMLCLVTCGLSLHGCWWQTPSDEHVQLTLVALHGSSITSSSNSMST